MNWMRSHMAGRSDTLRALMLAACCGLAACSTQVASEQAPSESLPTDAVHPVSGLDVIILKVTSGETSHGFQVEVAASREEQRQGLMFRTSMGADEGMIFPFEEPRWASFWMRNTVIPLDIIFIDPDGRIINIAENTTPYSEESVRSLAPAGAVLELNAGRSAELGIGPGDLVEW